MTGPQTPPRKYGDADGYDNYMGSWSAALSPLFLDFIGLDDRAATIVDLGCGTGSLLVAVARRCPNARLVGIDPSLVLLGKAQRRAELAGVTFREGTVEQMPIGEASADAILSMLVLQEFSDRALALNAMVRATRAGGLIAACQWDFANMPVIDALVQAIASIDPTAGARVTSSTPAAFTTLSEVADCWRQAGLTEVRADRIAVTRTFASFEEVWTPLLAGSTPSTLMLASLSSEGRRAVRQEMQIRLDDQQSLGRPISLTAEAFAVMGTRRAA